MTSCPLHSRELKYLTEHSLQYSFACRGWSRAHTSTPAIHQEEIPHACTLDITALWLCWLWSQGTRSKIDQNSRGKNEVTQWPSLTQERNARVQQCSQSANYIRVGLRQRYLNQGLINDMPSSVQWHVSFNYMSFQFSGMSTLFYDSVNFSDTCTNIRLTMCQDDYNNMPRSVQLNSLYHHRGACHILFLPIWGRTVDTEYIVAQSMQNGWPFTLTSHLRTFTHTHTHTLMSAECCPYVCELVVLRKVVPFITEAYRLLST